MSRAQKTPLSRALTGAIASGSTDEIAQLGLSLPGHVTSISGVMVTVAFDVLTQPPIIPGQAVPLPTASLPPVTIPLACAEYVRLPIQVNDVGLAVPASVLLASISGLSNAPTPVLGSDGVPNLSALYWLPIGSRNFTAVNPDYLVLYGPQAVEILGVPPAVGTGPSIVADSTSITLTVGSSSIVINSAGVTIMGRNFLTHEHVPGTYNVDGSPVTGDSGAVV